MCEQEDERIWPYIVRGMVKEKDAEAKEDVVKAERPKDGVEGEDEIRKKDIEQRRDRRHNRHIKLRLVEESERRRRQAIRRRRHAKQVRDENRRVAIEAVRRRNYEPRRSTSDTRVHDESRRQIIPDTRIKTETISYNKYLLDHLLNSLRNVVSQMPPDMRYITPQYYIDLKEYLNGLANTYGKK